MKEPGYLLLVLLFVVSFLIFFVGRWVYRKLSPHGFEIKTFCVRFIVSPLLFLYMLHANLNHSDTKSLIAIVMSIAVLDRARAWFDRNVPDSDPRKCR